MSEQKSGIRAKQRVKRQFYNHPLTFRQHAFVLEYIKELANRVPNGANAAERAGYKGSRETLYKTAQRLLEDTRVNALIDEKTATIMEKLEITAERVIEELGKLAFVDPRKFFNPDGSLKQVTELDDNTAMALAGMDVTELFEGSGEDRRQTGLLKKFKLTDKGQNLERLGRYFKLFTDRFEGNFNDNRTPAERIAAALARAERKAAEAAAVDDSESATGTGDSD